MRQIITFLILLIPNGLLALNVIIPNIDVPVGCYPSGRFIYHQYNVVMITGLDTYGEYYIRRFDNFDFTPPLSIVELLYGSGEDHIDRDDFQIIGYSAEEGYKYRYLGTSDTAFFDYNFEIPNEGLILGESTNRPAIRIRKVYTLPVIIARSIVTIVNPSSSITGTTLTCNGSGSYYLQYQPEGSSVSWTIKQNDVTRSQGIGTTAQASNLTNGSVDVEFAISFACNLDPIYVQNSFWSGVPAAPTVYPPSPLYVPINSVFYLSITDSPGADPSTGSWETYNCVSPNGSPTGAIAEFFSCSNDGCGTIYVSTENTCGTLYRTAITVITGTGGDCGELPESIEPVNFTVSPNPTSDFFELRLDSKIENKTNKKRVEIYNAYFHLVKSLIIFDSITRIIVSDLPKGTYIIRVYDGDLPMTRKLLIQR